MWMLGWGGVTCSLHSICDWNAGNAIEFPQHFDVVNHRACSQIGSMRATRSRLILCETEKSWLSSQTLFASRIKQTAIENRLTFLGGAGATRLLVARVIPEFH